MLAAVLLPPSLADVVSAFFRRSTISSLFDSNENIPTCKERGQPNSAGSGFGSSEKSTKTGGTAKMMVAADKFALETQWDTFASITDLKFYPLGTQ